MFIIKPIFPILDRVLNADWSLHLCLYTLRKKKGTKAVTGAVPLKKGTLLYILAPEMYILAHEMDILAPEMDILAPEMDT